MPATTLTMTAQDNLRLVLAGEEPAWMPFSPNFAQWFSHHRNHDILPEALRGCRDYWDAQRVLGCDLFSRNYDGGYRQCGPQPVVVTEERPIGTRTTRTVETPHGDLVSVHQQQRALSCSHVEAYPVRDWDVDGAAFRWWLDRLAVHWDSAPFEAMADRIGSDGIAHLPLACTPLKFLHHQFGLDGTCLFVCDEPEEADAVCADYWSRVRPALLAAAEHPQVESVILMDNVDTPFYAPDLARRYWAPFVADAADIMRARGKYLFVHACGKLAGLSAIIADTGVSGLEGIAAPPLGDWPAWEAVTCHERFVVIGGFSPHEQGFTRERLRAFLADLLPRLPQRRMIFSTACNTEITTPWETLELIRDCFRAYYPKP